MSKSNPILCIRMNGKSTLWGSLSLLLLRLHNTQTQRQDTLKTYCLCYVMQCAGYTHNGGETQATSEAKQSKAIDTLQKSEPAVLAPAVTTETQRVWKLKLTETTTVADYYLSHEFHKASLALLIALSASSLIFLHCNITSENTNYMALGPRCYG